MSGRAKTRTPIPPNRDKHENSPPRLGRPKRTTRPPAHYAQEQEIDTEQRNTRSQRKKKNQGKPVAQREAATSETPRQRARTQTPPNLSKGLPSSEEKSDDEMNYTRRSSRESKKNLALPSQSFDMNYRPWRIDPRHHNPIRSHALRTATNLREIQSLRIAVLTRL
jgi:Ca2+-dependent lipid-binding protein